MVLQAPMIAPPSSHFSSVFHRSLFLQGVPLHLIIVLSCALFCIAACGPFSTNEIKQRVAHDTHDSCNRACDAGCQSIYAGDISSDPGNSVTSHNLENVCINSHLFCFPSTLSVFMTKEHKYKAAVLEVARSHSHAEVPAGSYLASRTSNSSLSLDFGMFKLSNGRIVSCSLTSGEVTTHSANQNDISSYKEPILNEEGPSPAVNGNSRMVGLGPIDGSSPHVEINPAILDWGQNYLHFPSLAYLTVTNACNQSVLHVYEPFSTNMQFYSCNDSEFSLGPGEVASLCFVFLPNELGMSSSYLILQTSLGGFLVQARGSAIQSPYALPSFGGLDVSSSGRLSKNFSLFNLYNETLYVKEVAVWMAVSLGNTSYSTSGSCSIEDCHGSSECNSLRKEWLDVRSSQLGFQLMSMRPHINWEIEPGRSETLIEIDFSFDTVGKIFGALCMHIQTPSQVTTDRIMVPLEAELGGEATYNPLSDSSVSVLIEVLVPCNASGAVVFALSLRNLAPYLLNVVKIIEVSESTKLFQIKYVEGLILFPETVTRVAVVTFIELSNFQSAVHDIDDTCKLHVRTNDSSRPQIEIPCMGIIRSCFNDQWDSSGEYVYRSVRLNKIQWPSRTQELVMAEAEEMVLRNWKSQSTLNGVSVLDSHELLFPTVQVGGHHSRWITVKNPTHQPVVIQLILNSGEIIDECRGLDEPLQPSSSTRTGQIESTAPTRYGFSIPDASLTEVYIHPYGQAYVGPVVFHPLCRCGWRSTALIRNNLSGVEWLNLRGFGGVPSLTLLEGSKPVQRLEFNFNMNSTDSCSQPLLKDFYTKNTGDLPLEVRKIEVSGTSCGLDGFLVRNCKAFSLEAGQSKKLIVSYWPCFSSATEVLRDLELSLTTGILVIPMKASFPLNTLNPCEKSGFWNQVRKFSWALVLVSSLLFLVFCDFRWHYYVFTRMAVFLRPFLDINFSTVEFGGNSGSHSGNVREGTSAQIRKPSLDNHAQIRTTKEKRRRRRKRKGAAGLFEVSSSQSGNSTPSSPLSPLTPTLKQTWPPSPNKDQSIGGQSPFSETVHGNRKHGQTFDAASKSNIVKSRGIVKPSNPDQISEPISSASKVIVPEVSSPSVLTPSSSMASYARAPGPKFCSQEAFFKEEEPGCENEFTYDIWGDHFFGLHLGKESEISVSATESNSDSFFVRGPQALETKTKLRSVSFYCQKA